MVKHRGEYRRKFLSSNVCQPTTRSHKFSLIPMVKVNLHSGTRYSQVSNPYELYYARAYNKDLEKFA